MANLPYCWAAYTQFQTKLSKCSTLDDHAWGLEGALDLIFEPDFSPELTTGEQFERAASSAARKRRMHLARFLTLLDEGVNLPGLMTIVNQAEAENCLGKLDACLTNSTDRELLLGIASGQGYGELSQRLGQSEGSLRSRALRLRRKLSGLDR